MVEVSAASLNADAHSAPLDPGALNAAMVAQGAALLAAMSDAHHHLFADVPLYVTAEQVARMQAVIAAVEDVLRSGKSGVSSGGLGVFYGYDFHLNSGGAHLIEINTNAGGAFLNALLIASQRDAGLPGKAVADNDLEQSFIAMFRNEWRLARGDAPLHSLAIVDEQPQSQYLYPEFLLAKELFARAGIAAHIVDPSALEARTDGLYLDFPGGEQKIDLIYNRLADFSLRQYSHLHSAWENRQVVLTPDPAHYARYADKRRLALLTDEHDLQASGVPQANIEVLLRGIPQTKLVNAEDTELWWAERKQWFFKPLNGYGSKGAYRGDKVTKRVFEEIMRSDYVAQRLALPGERAVSGENGEPKVLKYDVRCYVYDGHIQLVAARLYQGQTTNFRTPGGGFAMVRVVG